MAGTFEIYEDRAGRWRFRLKTAAGLFVASGEAFLTKAGATRACGAVERAAVGAEIVDLTGETAAGVGDAPRDMPGFEQHVRRVVAGEPMSFDLVSFQLFVEEYDRRGDDLERRHKIPTDAEMEAAAARFINQGLEIDRLEGEVARLRAIEAAATALVGHRAGSPTRDGAWIARDAELFDALAAAVEGGGS